MQKEHSHHFVRVTLWILIGLLIVLGFVLWSQYRHIQKMRLTNSARLQFSTLRHGRTLTSTDTSYIQSWMTFDYINLSFKIPPTYLKTDLNITDSRYPRLSINRYGRDVGLDPSNITDEVRASVRAYLMNQAASTPL